MAKNILFADNEKEPIKKFLENECIPKIGVGINDNDLKKIIIEFPGIQSAGFTDHVTILK